MRNSWGFEVKAKYPVFEQGYDIDRCYEMADRCLVDSDQWHWWMDEARRLERLHRGRK